MALRIYLHDGSHSLQGDFGVEAVCVCVCVWFGLDVSLVSCVLVLYAERHSIPERHIQSLV